MTDADLQLILRYKRLLEAKPHMKPPRGMTRRPGEIADIKFGLMTPKTRDWYKRQIKRLERHE